jgi:hypothetical protein
VDKGRFRTKLAGTFDEIESAHGIDVEVIEGDTSGQIVRRLGGSVHDNGWFEILDEAKNIGAVSNVQFVVAKAREVADEALLVPASVALRAEKRFTLIVVDAVNGETVIVKKPGNFRADEAGRTCDQTDFAHAMWLDALRFGNCFSPDKGVIKRNSGVVRKQHLKH